MRNNQPVTGKAYAFPQDQTLISVTDLKGRITYCNNNFIVVSGYAHDELMGQPHNMVRHPDMPEEAFRDLWATIQSGNPWSGMVKNRRKNGDHYWVRANATPVTRDGQIVGYLSVRTAPKDGEVEAAEQLYARMREEAAAGRQTVGLDSGKVVRTTALGRLLHKFHLGAEGQLGLLILLPVLAPVLVEETGAPIEASLLAGLACALLAFLQVRRTYIRPLYEVLSLANRVAAGDLAKSVEVTQGGIMGRLQLALAQMAVSVRTVVRDVRHEVANLRGGAQEIAAGNGDLSARTESQASSLEQTAASIEEIAGTIKQTAQLAAQGTSLARETADVSRRSQEAVNSVAATMDDIAKSSGKIGNIIQVIEGVAFQTNILALNAAVEAARAGEQGRGFAVVASEVRALAQRTSTAAREVRQLIEESMRHVDAGTQQTTQAQSRMSEAMSSVEKTASLLNQIHTATAEQETGVSQINEAVTHLDSLTQQNAAMVEELAAAAKSMEDQVVKVHSSIRVFRLTDRDVTLAEEDAVALRRKYQKHEAGTSLDFDKALADHQQWRVTLRNAVLRSIGVDADQLRRDDCCDLGQWLHGEGSRSWRSTPGFVQLVDVHRNFHTEAGKVADVINQKQMERAGKMLESGTPFVEIGKEVTHAIRHLRDQGGKRQAQAHNTKASAEPVVEDWTTF